VSRLPDGLEPVEEYFRSQVLLDSVGGDGLRARLTFPSDLQGPPDTSHGGAVSAMLLELVRLFLEQRNAAGDLGEGVEMEVLLHRALPLETAVQAEVEAGATAWHSRILRDGRPVAEATIRPLAGMPEPPVPGLFKAWEAAEEAGEDVPAYEHCFGCGLLNSRGLQVRFRYTQGWMWKRVIPQPHFRSTDGRLFAGYLAVLCDELGWWLGALHAGECGVSNRLTLHLSAAPPGELLALGSRSRVRSTDVKGRTWQTEATVFGLEGQTVATARVQFISSPAFTKLMLPRFRLVDERGAVARAFPRYRDALR
jgi:acyl-coenzyme A thioesterase PaaI-like protein